MVENGILIALTKMIDQKDIALQEIVLRAISKILAAGESEIEINQIAKHFEELGGIRIIEPLQEKSNETIYKLITEILTKFYKAEEVSVIEKPDNSNNEIANK